ncbi:hypothetical protein [Legionella hackeliae]|uniref:Transmembrane protein n=1 Tax=Legionella hackeliae TaxID=449 RepID=A0A0A8UT73_LEGHA|nr:hypothetical protein [Legionella hackeliae]KTD10470.1 hypothetical protein Lhac_2838 [Legionella hackeliae]CEK09974.1 membrane protein of unknown function [Legionella hackeliae]STX49886.1 Uncharacterised protein [Legionella hackeliae]
MALEKNDVSLNPRFTGAIFFAIYSLLIVLFTKYTLVPLKDSALIPTWPSVILAIVIGILTGSLFGKSLARDGSWLRSFLIGILAASFILFCLSLAIFIHFYYTGSPLLDRLQYWQDHLVFYGVILATLFLTLGIWFIPLTGLISLYFNKRFWPGLLTASKKPLKKDNDLPHE